MSSARPRGGWPVPKAPPSGWRFAQDGDESKTAGVRFWAKGIGRWMARPVRGPFHPDLTYIVKD